MCSNKYRAMFSGASRKFFKIFFSQAFFISLCLKLMPEKSGKLLAYYITHFIRSLRQTCNIFCWPCGMVYIFFYSRPLWFFLPQMTRHIQDHVIMNLLCNITHPHKPWINLWCGKFLSIKRRRERGNRLWYFLFTDIQLQE